MNFTISSCHMNISYRICFFFHVRVDVNMCLMCKDYRFYVLIHFYAIDVNAGLEVFFIFDIFYCVVALSSFYQHDFIKQGPMVKQSRLNGTPCINILEKK